VATKLLRCGKCNKLITLPEMKPRGIGISTMVQGRLKERLCKCPPELLVLDNYFDKKEGKHIFLLGSGVYRWQGYE
jgi:hypothetical protein